MYEIGGNQVPVQASEAIGEIPSNRTLLVQQLTDNAPTVPQAVYGLQTIGDVFAEFKPNVEVAFQDEEGKSRKETFHYEGVGDFSAKSLIKRSAFLQETDSSREIYERMTKQLRTNRTLIKMLENKDAKDALIQVLKALSEELEEK